MVYKAHTLQNYFNSGLVLAGQKEDGELEFIGTDEQWRAFTVLEELTQSNGTSDKR